MLGDFLRYMRVYVFLWGTLEITCQLYLSHRQLIKAKAAKDVPSELSDIVTETEHRAASAYEVDKQKFSIYSTTVEHVKDGFELFYLFPFLWTLAVSWTGHNSIYRSSVIWYFLTAYNPVGLILDTGFSYYSQFVLEANHGFNKMTMYTFVTDKIKGLLLGIVLGTPIQLLMIKVVLWGGDQFFVYLWITTILLTLFMVAIVPVFIMPLFNKYEPLHDDVLRVKIENLAATLKFPLFKLLQMDGSKRSAHSNAFFYGFWRFKRIVLFDTLLHLDHEEILAILCHELGHWKLWHTMINMIMGFTTYLFYLTVYKYVHNSVPVFAAFGFKGGRCAESIVIGIPILMRLTGPLNLILGRIQILVTRLFEYQADAFAHGMGYTSSMKAALGHLSTENKSFADPDHLYAWWHFSHPTVLERRQALTLLDDIKVGKAKK